MDAPPRRRWLTDLATLHDAIAGTATLRRACAAALAEACEPGALSGWRHSWSELVEDRLLRRLTDGRTAPALSREAVAAAGRHTIHDLQPVAGVTVEPVAGRFTPCDLVLVWHHDRGAPTRVPVNVKVLNSVGLTATPKRAVALAPLLWHLTDPAADLSGSVPKGIESDRLLVELMAGRKLVRGRDYYILQLRHTGGQLDKVTMRGLVSRLSAGGEGLAIDRTSTRDEVSYHLDPGPLIGPHVDVARELAHALLPSPRQGRVAAQVLAAAPRSKRKALAARIDGLTDEQLLNSICA